jgi:hypothetical protein
MELDLVYGWDNSDTRLAKETIEAADALKWRQHDHETMNAARI